MRPKGVFLFDIKQFSKLSGTRNTVTIEDELAWGRVLFSSTTKKELSLRDE